MILCSQSFSKVFVVSSFPNSTYDLYIAPRISSDIQVEIINPASKISELENCSPNGALIIINRYVNIVIIRWLEKNRAQIAKIVWLVDDDFNAMATSFDIPIFNRVRPVTTLLYKKRLRALCDHVFVSSSKLSEKFGNWPASIIGPVADIKDAPRPLDTRHLYYFSKMHSAEHRFLFPIIRNVLEDNQKVQFTVIANGKWGAKWQRLNRVNILSEMPYLEYQAFLRGLPMGGLFLVPLTDTKLNASRSDAKLIDVAKSGSAALISNHPAYAKFLQSNSISSLGIKGVLSQDWIEVINALINDQSQAEQNKNAVYDYARSNYENREMIC